jgi:hypothetical protein
MEEPKLSDDVAEELGWATLDAQRIPELLTKRLHQMAADGIADGDLRTLVRDVAGTLRMIIDVLAVSLGRPVVVGPYRPAGLYLPFGPSAPIEPRPPAVTREDELAARAEKAGFTLIAPDTPWLLLPEPGADYISCADLDEAEKTIEGNDR